METDLQKSRALSYQNALEGLDQIHLTLYRLYSIALTLYDLVRFSRENPQKIMILSELSLSIAANFEGESAYLIKQPRKHLLSL